MHFSTLVSFLPPAPFSLFQSPATALTTAASLNLPLCQTNRASGHGVIQCDRMGILSSAGPSTGGITISPNPTTGAEAHEGCRTVLRIGVPGFHIAFLLKRHLNPPSWLFLYFSPWNMYFSYSESLSPDALGCFAV